MALQNRVLPTSEIIAHPGRGSFMGNRGILHGPDKTLGKARWRHKAWIICALSFKGRHSEVMPANRYTRLFFLDEAVALAAGHRPCAECRRADFNDFKAHWAAATQMPHSRAADVDQTLHQERVDRKTRKQKTSKQGLDDLPGGAFIGLPGDDRCYLVLADRLYAYGPSGYLSPVERPKGIVVDVLTPVSTLEVLKRGYLPHFHESAKR